MLTRVRAGLYGFVIGGALGMVLYDIPGGWPLLILGCLEMWRHLEEVERSAR